MADSGGKGGMSLGIDQNVVAAFAHPTGSAIFRGRQIQQ
jgi:hypothetical protein